MDLITLIIKPNFDRYKRLYSASLAIKKVLGVCGIVLLCSCSSSSENTDVIELSLDKGVVNANFETLIDYWNNNKLSEFVTMVNQSYTLMDPDSHLIALIKVRKEFGDISYSDSLSIKNFKRKNKIFYVASKVMIGRKGNMNWALEYDSDSKIVGYQIKGQPFITNDK